MDITVIYAVYGTTTIQVDVTELCQGIVDGGATAVSVNNDTFGGDPSPDVKKSFAIIYQLSSATNPTAYIAAVAVEGTSLDLAP